MKFLGNVLATIVGLIIFSVIAFFGLFLIGTLLGGSGDEKVNVKKNSVIELDLSKVQHDYAGKVHYKDFDFFDTPNNGLVDIFNAIDYAKTDNNIKGIIIRNNQQSLGLAQCKALRDKLNEFKKVGKFIVAYSDVLGQGEYYVNSVADEIYLNPLGELDFRGLGSEVFYMKDMFQKLGVTVDVIRHGKYKSAAEGYFSQNMSNENREQISVYLNSAWQTITAGISESRKISTDSLNYIAENLSARTPEMALARKMIDKIGYEDEFHANIKKRLKVKENDEYNKISIADYTKSTATKATDYKKKDIIAVIYAQGVIEGGEGDINVIGEGSINRALKKARENKNVKAIVLRVDSPGGSALTSELIWREIELTKKVKPVVVSMGNVAASGGYYIACNANRIFAEPSTITGSIGVFGVVPNVKPLADKWGFNAEQVTTHKNAIPRSMFEAMSDNFKQITYESIETIYSTFLKRVSDGRKMTTQQVDAIAQGRVWTGADALKIGLVDELGGLEKAISHAAKLGKTTSYRTEAYPEFEKTFEDLLSNLTGGFIKTKKDVMIEELGEENYRMFQQVTRVQKLKGAQAIMPFELNIR